MSEGMVREKLNIYYLLDTSGSMSGPRIEQLNSCMSDLKPALEEAGIEHCVEIVVRAIEFGNNGVASWHTGSEANSVPIDKFIWGNLKADGPCTPTSAAIEMVANSINPEYLGKRALRPIVIMITDGGCTDDGEKYSAACQKLASKIKGNVTRIAVGVVGAERAELEQFASKGTIGEKNDQPFVFEAKTPEAMTEIIRWASVVSIGSSVKTSVGGDDAPVLSSEGVDDEWI